MNIQEICKDFLILGRTVCDKPSVYLDSRMTAQKLYLMVDSVASGYYSVNVNAHRGAHFLS